jgi:hypothetical protein
MDRDDRVHFFMPIAPPGWFLLNTAPASAW